MNRLLFSICEWPASMYNEKSRRWLYGILAVLPEDISFTETGKPDNDAFRIPYEDLIEVKKSRTGLIFHALYLVTKENKKIWFSSLSERDGVFAALTHFWQAKLFHKSKSKKQEMKGSKTEMGQRLLELVKDSEGTLSNAAVQLHYQGRQIDNALDTMEDLHNDLDVADNLLEGIESWFGKWRLPDEYQHIDPVFVNKSDIPEMYEFEVLFNKLEASRANARQIGSLRISKDGLTIMSMQMRNEHHFRWSDVSQIRVVTPWELMVTKFQIGKPDLVYNLVSANMAVVLKLLDKCARYKMKYDTPPEKVLCVNHKKTDERAEILHGGSKGRALSGSAVTHNVSNVPSGIDQLQIDQSTQVVSDKEADEISRTLAGLKSLALAVQEEESTQIEKIDSLTATVDRANQRLAGQEKRTKKIK